VAIDILKILVKGSAIAGAAVFNTLAEIPVALEIVNLVISL
jgi:predicted CoA-binding protein